METSEHYIVSARKYRPPTFRDVVGQSALTQTLKNAIEQNKLAHAYLFCGPRGVGKTSCARIFAKTINCLNKTKDGEACGECESCRSIDAGVSYNLIELDAASNNSVNEMRDFIEQVQIPPQVGKYRVFIIDEVHMLTTQAFNAFLKTLEEPPSYVVFILATTEKHKVLPTILSRCQIYDFKRITINDTVEHLKYVASQEGITAEATALNVIARKADGAMRDALSIFDQVAASSMGNITYQSAIDNLNVLDYDVFFRLTETFRTGDVPGALLIYKEIRDRGFDSLFFVNGLASHVRDLMVAFDARTVPLLEVGDEIGRQYTEQARSLPIAWYYQAMKLLNDCDVAYRTSGNKQLLVELTLIRLCQLLSPTELSEQPQKPIQQPKQSPAPQSAPKAPAAPAVPAAPKAAPAPAPQAASSLAPAAPRVPNIGGTAARPRTTRINAPKAAESAETSDDAPADRAFTPEEFLKAWDEFAAENGDQHILVNAMQTLRPTPLTATEYRVPVNHPAMQQAYEQQLTNLATFLRRKLGNKSLSLKIEMTEAQMVERKLTQAELLKTLVSENDVIADLLQDIEAEMV